MPDERTSRILKSKWFQRFARREDLPDSDLLDAVIRAESGQIDADLGGCVIKQRIARHGGGKSGGYRSIIMFRRGVRAVFVYGFAKSQRQNLSPREVSAYKEAAPHILRLSERELDVLIEEGDFVEVQRP